MIGSFIIKKKKKPKAMIGWREWCALPSLDLPAVRVKIDTGARTSALHAYDIKIKTKGKKSTVHFKVHPLEKNQKISKVCKAPLLGHRIVVSSNGKKQLRPVIAAKISINGSTFDTELTLTSRDQMNFRMLLGRKALRAGRFTVEPAKSFLMGKIPHPEKLYKKPKT
jgi:ribosomal protein S6--L-glutamate ligase